MVRQGGDTASLWDIVRSALSSSGMWSVISAVVGGVGVAAGGIIFLTVDELSNFSVSVLIIGIALLALALVLSPRAVAMFLAGRRGRYGVNVIVMTLAFFAIAILVNFLLFRNTTRFDVTATRALTLSPQTLKILDELETDVRANAFFVENDPRTAFARDQAEDLLNEFERHSSRFAYRFIDPQLKRSVATRYDVTEFPSIVFEDLTQNRLEKVASPTEQAFVTGILVATGVEQKVLYFLTGHDEASETRDLVTGAIDDEGFDLALDGMRRDNYAVIPLNLRQFDRVPENAAVLLIAGPRQNLDEQETQALVDYIKRGGAVVALLDPDPPESFASVFQIWAVGFGRDSIADAVSNVGGELLTPMIQRTNGQFPSSEVTGVSIVDQIGVAFFPEVTSVGLIVPRADLTSGITFAPLAITTPASWLESDPENVSLDTGQELRGPFTVAAAVQAAITADERERHLPAKLVVFGDSDFAKNKFFSSSQNGDLLLNSVNWLAEDFELISIRPKLIPFRELVVNTRERDFIKWSSWFLPPAVMVVLGSIVWWRRR